MGKAFITRRIGRNKKEASIPKPLLSASGGVERIRTSAPVTQPNDLANRPLQPLEYFSRSCAFLAERVGFEPTVPSGITGFQDRLLKPLGHLSTDI